MSQELHIDLPDDLRELVATLVESGAYQDANDVVVQALRILAEQRQVRDESIAYLRAEIARGLEQSEHEELMDGDVFFRSINARFGDAS